MQHAFAKESVQKSKDACLTDLTADASVGQV